MELYKLCETIVHKPDDFLFDLSWFSDYFRNFDDPAVLLLFKEKLKKPYCDAFLDKDFIIPIKSLNILNSVILKSSAYGVAALFSFVYYKCCKGHVVNSSEYKRLQLSFDPVFKKINQSYQKNYKCLSDLEKDLIDVMKLNEKEIDRLETKELNLDFKLLTMEGKLAELVDQLDKKEELLFIYKQQHFEKVAEANDKKNQVIANLNKQNNLITKKFEDYKVSCVKIINDMKVDYSTLLDKNKSVEDQLTIEKTNFLLLKKEMLNYIARLEEEKLKLSDTKNHLSTVIDDRKNSITTISKLRDELNLLVLEKNRIYDVYKKQEFINSDQKELCNTLQTKVNLLSYKVKEKKAIIRDTIEYKLKRIDDPSFDINKLENYINKKIILFNRFKEQKDFLNISPQNQQSKFFGFPYTEKLDRIVKNISFNQITLKMLMNHDPKNCSIKIQQILLFFISKLCSRYGGRSSVWYRNFLSEKSYSDSILSERRFSKTLRFYITYINPFCLSTVISLDTFLSLSATERRIRYEKEYQVFDKENKTCISIFNNDCYRIQMEDLHLKEKNIDYNVFYRSL